MMTGCSAVLVARLNGVQEAVSSILATRTKRSNDFMLEIVGSFLFYPRVSLRLDHNSDHKGGKAACSCPERMKMQNRSPCRSILPGRGCGFQVWEGSGLSPGGSACSAA